MARTRQHAIIWTNLDPVHWCIFATPGGDELNKTFSPGGFGLQVKNCQWSQILRKSVRGVTIRVPHDTIRNSIQRSRYDTYLDTYLNTVRCQRDAVSSMKTETPVIRNTVHNLLFQWMEYLLLQLPLVERKHDFAQLFQVYIRLFPSTWSEKICVLIDPFQE